MVTALLHLHLQIFPLPPQGDTQTLFKTSESKTAIAQRVVDLWNSTVTRLPKVRRLTDTRKKYALARLEERTIEELGELFGRLDHSDLAAGSNWATFDWVMKSSNNAAKVEDGNYDNKPVFNGTPSAAAAATAADYAKYLEGTQ
jgi:hypothetical protein